MKMESKKELLRTIEVTRESMKNNIELCLDNYCEVVSKLDLITYLILNDNKMV